MPEKTLEHWTSMYLARRFPNASLWWPAAGEDIQFEGLPGRIGKSVMLEIKTTEWNGSKNQHRLTLDVEQLDAYQESKIPVYYVLPVPPWSGSLIPGNPWLGVRRPSELLLPGSRWFGSWTFVVSAAHLWQHLDGKNNRQSQKTATLFTHTTGNQDLKIVAPPLHTWWTWEEFWDLLGSCGSATMPSLICSPGTPYLGQRAPRKRLTESLAAAEDVGLLSAPADGRRTSSLYASEGTNDVYAELSEDTLKQALQALNGHHQNTAILHLPAKDVAIEREQPAR
jgi:hypothetical protein